jgi:hypothetical protein
MATKTVRRRGGSCTAAESFVDSVKTELIRVRVSRTRMQLDLVIVEHVG